MQNSSWLFTRTWVQVSQCHYLSPKPLFLSWQKTTLSENFIHWALNIVVMLLQSKSTKTANFSESWGTVDPPNWGPLFGLNSLRRGPHSLKKKKFPSAAKQRTVAVHSLAASMRRIRVCIHLSVLQSLSSFTSLSVVPLLFHHSLGPRLCLFHPCQALFQRLSLGNCTAISNSLAFTIIKFVLPTHSLLPSLKAAPSVAMPLNPACLKVSTWLHVHTPTLITV